MSTLKVNPFELLVDTNGTPLDAGYIYIGVENLDPETNPISVYYDAALTVPVSQPIRTVNGYVLNAGVPVTLYVATSYSIRVRNKNLTQMYYSPSSSVLVNNNPLATALAASSGSSLVGYIQSGVGAVARTVQDRLRDQVFAKDYGVTGDGTTDDTTKLQSILDNFKHVVISAGMTPLISSTITVPASHRVTFEGAFGNPALYPSSYLIKAASMTTAGIVLMQSAVMDGGGVVGKSGNTGDGIVLAQNAAKLIKPFTAYAGGVGIRVGGNVGNNSNGCAIEYPVCIRSGSHGIYVHDGLRNDCNTCTITAPQCFYNGNDGIRLGHTYWTTVISPQCETNGGWGLYVSGDNNANYPECRWANILGGDVNEGNTLGACFDASYYSTFVIADGTSLPTTAPNGLQGSAQRNVIGGFNGATFTTVNSTGGSNLFFSPSGVTTYPVVVRTNGTNSVSNGGGVRFEIDRTGGSSTFNVAGAIRTYQLTTNTDGLEFLANNSGTLTSIAKISTYYNGFSPSAATTYDLGHSALPWRNLYTGSFTLSSAGFIPTADNTTDIGSASLRCRTIYAGTGTINTSDMREKQQIKNLSIKEKAVAVRLKGLIKTFKFNDAVKSKKDNARIHVGVMAQEVKAAFEAEGLIAENYAILCYDEWEELPEIKHPAQDEIKDEEGNVTQEAIPELIEQHYRPAGNRYGVRYDELFAFIISAL